MPCLFITHERLRFNCSAEVRLWPEDGWYGDRLLPLETAKHTGTTGDEWRVRCSVFPQETILYKGRKDDNQPLQLPNSTSRLNSGSFYTNLHSRFCLASMVAKDESTFSVKISWRKTGSKTKNSKWHICKLALTAQQGACVDKGESWCDLLTPAKEKKRETKQI